MSSLCTFPHVESRQIANFDLTFKQSPLAGVLPFQRCEWSEIGVFCFLSVSLFMNHTPDGWDVSTWTEVLRAACPRLGGAGCGGPLMSQLHGARRSPEREREGAPGRVFCSQHVQVNPTRTMRHGQMVVLNMRKACCKAF